MSDIVERLRNDWDCVPGDDAADEIERLRASCERAHLDSAAFAEAMSEKSAEIERLREELLSRDNKLRAKAEEIERLRGLLREGLKVRTWYAQQGWQSRVREALGNAELLITD